MLSKYVKPGDKVEVQAVERVKFADGNCDADGKIQADSASGKC